MLIIFYKKIAVIADDGSGFQEPSDFVKEFSLKVQTGHTLEAGY